MFELKKTRRVYSRDKTRTTLCKCKKRDADDEKRARQTKEQTTYDTDEEEEDFINAEYDAAAMEDEIERDVYGGSDTGTDADAMDIDRRGRGKGIEDDDESETESDRIEQAKTKFLSNLKVATSFEYSEDRVHFELEVSVSRCTLPAC